MIRFREFNGLSLKRHQLPAGNSRDGGRSYLSHRSLAAAVTGIDRTVAQNARLSLNLARSRFCPTATRSFEAKPDKRRFHAKIMLDGCDALDFPGDLPCLVHRRLCIDEPAQLQVAPL